MLTALDVPAYAFDEDELDFVSKVREHGWFRTEVFCEDGDLVFSFTTGFWTNANQSELVMFSFKREIAHETFWYLFRDAQFAKNFSIGKRANDVFENFPAYTLSVAKHHCRDYLGWSQ